MRFTKNHSNEKAVHSIFGELQINRIVLPLGAFFIAYLIGAVMIDFALFIKTVVISSVLSYLYFAISWTLSFYDKMKKEDSSLKNRISNGIFNSKKAWF